MNYSFNFTTTKRNWEINVDDQAQYGCFQNGITGTEGGLWFDNKELIDCDGTPELPPTVAAALREAGYTLDETFDYRLLSGTMTNTYTFRKYLIGNIADITALSKWEDESYANYPHNEEIPQQVHGAVFRALAELNQSAARDLELLGGLAAAW